MRSASGATGTAVARGPRKNEYARKGFGPEVVVLVGRGRARFRSRVTTVPRPPSSSNYRCLSSRSMLAVATALRRGQQRPSERSCARARFAWRRRRRKRQQQMRRSSLDAAAYVRGAVWGRLAGRRSRCVGRSLLDDAAAGVPRVAGAGRGGAGRHVREGGIPLVHGARQLRFLR